MGKGRVAARLPDEVVSDLKRSGLDVGDARLLRIEARTAAQLREQTKLGSRSGYVLPYFDLDGKPTTYHRVRFLGEQSPVEVLSHGALKYWQPPKALPHLYFPPYLSWRAVLDDVAQPLYLVEGEKKAALGVKLLKRAFAGIGGVWSWTSKKAAVEVIPDLLPFLKPGRRVILVFDTEAVENVQVYAAREALTSAIWKRGAAPEILTLPALSDREKTGLDDFLVAKGPKAVRAFEELAPVPSEYALALNEVSNELCYIEQQHAVYSFKTGALFDRPQRLTQLAYANRKVWTMDRAGKMVEKNVVAEWLSWSGRRAHTALAYEPAGKPVTERNELNVWPGWGVTPKRGPVTLFLELLDRFFEGATSEHRRWFLRWLAYPLQHPGQKLATAVVLFSREHGTGKTLIGETIGRIYGKNFTVLNAEALHSPFNTWARHKQFVLGEELTGSERRADAERLKLLVTQERVVINAKFQPSYELPDRANYLLTTNHADALNLDVYDRRFFVHEVISDKLPAEFFQRYDRWYRSDAGAGAIFQYLLDFDLGDFGRRDPAPATKAKVEMQSLSDQPVDFNVRQVIEAPEAFLNVGGKPIERDLFKTSELLIILDPEGRKRLTEHALAKALRRAGIRQLEPTRVSSGPARLYAIRNQRRWLDSTHAERAAHYDGVPISDVKPDPKVQVRKASARRIARKRKAVKRGKKR